MRTFSELSIVEQVLFLHIGGTPVRFSTFYAPVRHLSDRITVLMTEYSCNEGG
jgi:hypothetical protein